MPTEDGVGGQELTGGTEWGSLGRLLGVPNVWVLLMHFVGLQDRNKVVLSDLKHARQDVAVKGLSLRMDVC